MKKRTLKRRRAAALLLCVAAMLFSLTACGAGSLSNGSSGGGMLDCVNSIELDTGFTSNSDYDSSDSKPPAEPGQPSESPAGPDNELDAYLASRKIIRNANLTCETKDYDNFMLWLAQTASDLSGYVESMDEDQSVRYSNRLAYASYNSYDYAGERYDAGEYMTRSANITLRVRADRLDEFLNRLGGQCNVVSKSVTSEDITLQYVDTESYIKALEIERDRLLELLDEADNIDTMLTIESKLTDVKYRLDAKQSELRLMDNHVNFSTVQIYLTEVVDFTEITGISMGYFSRLGGAFVYSFKSLVDFLERLSLWFAENFAGLVFLAFVIAIIVQISKKRAAKRTRRNFEAQQRAFAQRHVTDTHPGSVADEAFRRSCHGSSDGHAATSQQSSPAESLSEDSPADESHELDASAPASDDDAKS